MKIFWYQLTQVHLEKWPLKWRDYSCSVYFTELHRCVQMIYFKKSCWQVWLSSHCSYNKIHHRCLPSSTLFITSNSQWHLCVRPWPLKVDKAHTLDIAPNHEPSPQNCSGMARVLKGSHSFTCTPTRSSAIGMSQTCLCLPSYSWYSFTDRGRMEGWVGPGGWLRFE